MTVFMTHVCNGLGDRLLDVVGFTVLCSFFGVDKYIDWAAFVKNRLYDVKLLQLPCDIKTKDTPADIVVHNENQSVSLSPIHVFATLKRTFPDITFEEVVQRYISTAQSIKPSCILEPYVPDLRDHICIHLRRTDKLTNCGDMRHETNMLEYDAIMGRLMTYLNSLIDNGSSKFYVISDDPEYKQVFIEKLHDIAKSHTLKVK